MNRPRPRPRPRPPARPPSKPPAKPPASGAGAVVGRPPPAAGGIQNPTPPRPPRNIGGALGGAAAAVGIVGTIGTGIAGIILGRRGADSIDNVINKTATLLENPMFLAVAGGVVLLVLIPKK